MYKEVNVEKATTKTSNFYVPIYWGKENTLTSWVEMYISGPYHKLTITFTSISRALRGFSRNLSPALSLSLSHPYLAFLLTHSLSHLPIHTHTEAHQHPCPVSPHRSSG